MLKDKATHTGDTTESKTSLLHWMLRTVNEERRKRPKGEPFNLGKKHLICKGVNRFDLEIIPVLFTLFYIYRKDPKFLEYSLRITVFYL